VLLDLFLECLLLATIDNDGADLAATFRDAHDSGLVFSALSQLSAVAFEQGACSVLSRRSSFRLLQLPRSASRKFQIASLCENRCSINHAGYCVTPTVRAALPKRMLATFENARTTVKHANTRVPLWSC
jgi:hypothetical protein